MSKRIQVIASIISVFIIAFAASASYLVINQTTTAQESRISRQPIDLFLTPAETHAKLGDLLSLELNVDSGERKFSTVLFQLNYDPSLVEFVSFTPSNKVSGEPKVTADSQSGTINFSLTMDTQLFALNNIGTFELKTLKPSVTTTITFSDSSLVDSLTPVSMGTTAVVE